MKTHNQQSSQATLSPRSLPYARLALTSLFLSSIEKLHLSLITDSAEDKKILTEEIHSIEGTDLHQIQIYDFADLNNREDELFRGLDRLRDFRRGHPCWRKITDPLLLSSDGQEMILLDPDLYFPNPFRFETTPESGLLLMWQKPSCLFPPEVVQTAIDAKISLAHHVDIGVAHWRFPVDLEWLNWLIGQLGSPHLPRSMHVEAIVWAALAMRMGGGHLDPRHWLCWHRSQYKRVLRKAGVSGTFILSREKLSTVKCFHAGGEAKWWLPEAQKLGLLNGSREATQSFKFSPFIELTPAEFKIMQRNRNWLRKLGYYTLFHPG